MATSKLTPQELQNLHDLASQWGKSIARRALGENGPGLEVDLLTLEQVAQTAARGLTAATLATLLAQQAQALPPDCPCPDCGQRCPVAHEPRSPISQGGTLTYREPVCHCPACRRDFSPSASHLAAGQP